MKIKTSELAGLALDYAVTKSEGYLCDWHYNLGLVSYSTNWAQAGQIIEREKVDIMWEPNGKPIVKAELYINRRYSAYGHTPLIAAMRCFVLSRLGACVDIPEGLQ